MSALAVTASTVLPGEELRLAPRELTLTASLDCPACAMEGVFPLERFPAECLALAVRKGDKLLFEGRVDRQKATLSPKGMSLVLEARDKGALLLDNEALPAAYRNLNAQYLFQRLIAAHGFVLVSASGTTVPSFTIRKGWSLWDAFSTFTRMAYGLEPYVSGDMVVADTPATVDWWVLGTREYPILSLEYAVDHYQALSRVCIRDGEGDYPTQIDNQEALARGIARTRYLIPAGEYAALPVWDAHQRIRRGMREMERVTLVLPGTLAIRPGQGVQVNHPAAALPRQIVTQVVHRLSAAGETTTLTLANAFYY